MSERATRPLNSGASRAADDELYANHANDPRPNALYDESGNRKPLSANDPDQADLRSEWMNAYKANGGETEPTNVNGTPPGQAVLPCGQKAKVKPLIVGTPLEFEESGDDDAPTDDEEEPEEEEEEEVEDDEDVDEDAGEEEDEVAEAESSQGSGGVGA